MAILLIAFGRDCSFLLLLLVCFLWVYWFSLVFSLDSFLFLCILCIFLVCRHREVHRYPPVSAAVDFKLTGIQVQWCCESTSFCAPLPSLCFRSHLSHLCFVYLLFIVVTVNCAAFVFKPPYSLFKWLNVCSYCIFAFTREITFPSCVIPVTAFPA